MKRFSFLDRKENIHNLKFQNLDILVVGGGITGAGVARDAAMRGMKVGLVEASDFASGTSSRSSKLIHGGLRYLENMEFGLVFEALNERTKLFSMAPHLVHPLRFMIPLYEDSRVGMFKMGMGMWLYDALSLFQAPEMHERLSSIETVNRIPSIRQDRLCGSYVYSDAYMDDDRLVIETLRSANDYNAFCVNYVKLENVEFAKNGETHRVYLKDQLTGKEFQTSAKHIVSSVGPWTDKLGNQIFSNWKKILRPTKGIHITLPKERLNLSSAVVMAAENSNRIVFAIPRHEMIIVGTTDTDFSGDPAAVVATEEDIRYLLKIVGNYFPGAKITPSDIIASYAGVRPLVNDGAENEGKTSREHSIFTHENGALTFVAGGKYTTYRLMSQQVIQHVLERFPLEERVRFSKVETDLPLNPLVDSDALLQASAMVKGWSESTELSQETCSYLALSHGMEAAEIIGKFESLNNLWKIEAAHAIENTMCLNLKDFYSRRVHLFLAEKNHGFEFLEGISEVFQEMLALSPEQIQLQKNELIEFAEIELSWKKAFLNSPY